MICEARGPGTEPVARIVKALVEARKVPRFAAMVEDGHVPWHCICMFEEEVLHWAHRNRWCACAEDWNIVVGWADDVPDVPKYVGWGDVQAWLTYDGCAVMVEPEYGVVVRPLDVLATVPLAVCEFRDDSGMVLNAALRAAS